MIGRSTQLDAIRQVIIGMMSSGIDANVLFVTGEAGIGKTTLLQAVLQECQRISPLPMTVHVECSTPLAGQDIGEVESLQPWEEIIRRLASGEQEKKYQTKKLVADLAMAWVRCIPVVGDVLESVADTAQIVRDHSRSSGGAPVAAANQQQVFQQYINVLEKIAEASPLVLMIDDFHWADTSSTNLLFTAARQLHGRRVLFIVAYRPDDAASSRSGEGHPILHVRNELERYSLSKEVGVPRMSAEDLDGLLRERYVNYQNNDSFEEWLARISSGNALFVTQFLHTLEEDGYIDRAGGHIKDHYESITPPATLQAVIRERIRRLNADARDVLRYASVEGDRFTLAVLSVVTEIPKLKLLQQLRHIEDDHHLIHLLGKQAVYGDATSVYEFSHALLHRTMYESLGEEEREILHEAVFALIENAWAAAQEQGLDIRTIAPRFAVHADVLGRHQRAAEVLLQGARANWQVYAGDEALRLLDGVFEQLSMPSTTTDEATDSRAAITANAHSLRGQIYFHRGHLATARQEFQTALELLEQTRDTVGVIDNLTKTAIIDTYDGDYERAAALAQSALEHARQIDHARGVFTAMNTLANIKRWTAPSSEVLDWRIQVLDAARRCGEGSFEEGVAFSNLGIARQALDDINGALECYNHALDIYSEHNDAGKMADALNNIGTVHLAAGRLTEAREVLERCCDLCKAIGDEWMEAYAVNNIADVDFKEEEYQAALDKYYRTAIVADRVGDRELGAGAYSRIGSILRINGDLLEAVGQYQQSLERYRQHNAHDAEAAVCIEIADIFLQLGDNVQARIWSEQAGKRAARGVDPAVVAYATGELGMVEAAEAQQYVGVVSQQKLASAISRIEQCINALQAVNDSDLEKWKTRLTELRGREG